MKVVLFCHSLVSDWNHGNAHFLRGVCMELQDRGHELRVLEPAGGWSRANLVREAGEGTLDDFARAFPSLASVEYDLDTLDLDRELDGAGLVLVHEWSEPELVRRVGEHRERDGGYRLLFHDTHHRAASDPDQMARFDLSAYDGVLAFGDAVRRVYLDRGWTEHAWTWHEAADTRTFRPLPRGREADLIWIGNWGDGERADELSEFLLAPALRAGLTGSIHGVCYPERARERIREAGLVYRGWLANYRAPEAFARHRLTVHVPRRPYSRLLPGIPTIRVFEALACGIPLLCAPWDDVEGLFRPGRDYLVARHGAEMERHMRDVTRDADLADELRESGLETIRARHTCAHRVDELLAIHESLCAGAAA